MCHWRWWWSFKLTFYAGGHHCPSLLLNIFHIRKELPYHWSWIVIICDTKTIVEEFQESLYSSKLTAELCHHLKCTTLQGYVEALDRWTPNWIWIQQMLHRLHKQRNDIYQNYKMWPDLRKAGFHAHNNKTHFSPSNDSCTCWLTIQPGIDAKSCPGYFCCGLFLKLVRRPRVYGSPSNGCISPWQADSRL